MLLEILLDWTSPPPFPRRALRLRPFSLAEVFRGNLDVSAPAGLSHLRINETSGFATVLLVTGGWRQAELRLVTP